MVVYVLNRFSARQGSNDISQLVRQSRGWACRIFHDTHPSSHLLAKLLWSAYCSCDGRTHGAPLSLIVNNVFCGPGWPAKLARV